ncbi:MAG: type II toxin-antitoxin system RelE/ParE family toxin [Lactimicrobium sp.]|jgi:plasmid stabilization system protein ParE|uniref:type II toxin-antitoxin system RelE/ParE family toxin n=1 Tax=Lactimicrobium sp. TaxID=2563780 RepID=UPI002F35424A
MDSFNVLITPTALKMIDNIVDYILEEKDNPSAADAVYLDAMNTADQLETVAGSLGLCKRRILADRGYRKIHLRHHQYLLIYKIYKSTVVVEAIFHESEDYERKFEGQLKL